jgi:hypothetical protein
MEEATWNNEKWNAAVPDYLATPKTAIGLHALLL